MQQEDIRNYKGSSGDSQGMNYRKKPPSPDHVSRRYGVVRPEASSNGKWSGNLYGSPYATFSAMSPMPPDYDFNDSDHKPEDMDHGRRQRPRRYSARDYVEGTSDNGADTYCNDDIVGEAVYDEEYLRKCKMKRDLSSSSEEDQEYKMEKMGRTKKSKGTP
ncbi:DDT domain-containing protein DDR4 [Linum perenne]